jgi:hypothetical protein
MYGFTTEILIRSTMDAIIQVIENWSEAKDTDKSTFAVFFDFAKAFDTVDHEQLLIKLRDKLKLQPWLISWIAAYLTGRQQRVKCGNFASEWTDVEAGVIQGSVLGRILFILFISDINESLPVGVELAKYADDILAYIIYDSKTDVRALPQQIVDGIHGWCKANKMTLNIGKCKCLSVQRSTCTRPVLALPSLEGIQLQLVDDYKYLGFTLSSVFNWDDQWARVRTIVNKVPYLLKSLKLYGIKTAILVAVYRSYAPSHFLYSAPVLSATSYEIKEEMRLFHRRALRIIGVSPECAEEKFKIPSIENYLNQQCVNIAQKIYDNPRHAATANLRQRRITRTGRTTQSNFKFELPIARYAPYRDSFLQKFFHALRDGTTDLYKPREWGKDGGKYNGTKAQPKAALAAVRAAQPKRPARASKQ